MTCPRIRIVLNMISVNILYGILYVDRFTLFNSMLLVFGSNQLGWVNKSSLSICFDACNIITISSFTPFLDHSYLYYSWVKNNMWFVRVFEAIGLKHGFVWFFNRLFRCVPKELQAPTHVMNTHLPIGVLPLVSHNLTTSDVGTQAESKGRLLSTRYHFRLFLL